MSHLVQTEENPLHSKSSSTIFSGTFRLLPYFAVDGVSALASGAVVSPIVSAVDRAIAESAMGTSPLWSSFYATCGGLLRSPVAAVMSAEFRIVWALYAGTYAANNACCTLETATRTSAPTSKTAAIFATNSCLSLWKDSCFAKLFGTRAAGTVPTLAYAAWGVRDVVGMGFVFTLPPLLATSIAASSSSLSPEYANYATQLLLPMAIQPVVAPFHLAGYLLCSQPTHTLKEYLGAIRQQLGSVVVMRWIRGFPPYCLGAVANKSLRTNLRGALEKKTL